MQRSGIPYGVQVFAPDGTALPLGYDSGKPWFTTRGAGTYILQVSSGAAYDPDTGGYEVKVE